MAMLKYFRLILTIFCLLMFIYIFYFADKKYVNEWRIENGLSLNVKIDDLYLVNNQYNFSEICKLTLEQKKSNFFKICKYLKYNDVNVFKSNDEIIKSLRIFIVKKEFITELNNVQKDNLLKLIENLEESNEYDTNYKNYFIYKLK